MNQQYQIAKAPFARTDWLAYGAILVWIAALVAVWGALERYQYSAIDSPASIYIDHWPPGSRLPHQPGHSTLVLFLHPKCPCSRATLAELERLFTSVEGRTNDATDCVVDATMPENAGADWLDTDTLTSAKHLPNSNIVTDRGGREAAMFGATTSGTVVLFDKYGARKYAGGVTEFRGHEGDNAGLDALRGILCNQMNTAEGLPAFGCRLYLPEANRESESTDGLGAT